MFSKLLLINALVITNRQSQSDFKPSFNCLNRLHIKVGSRAPQSPRRMVCLSRITSASAAKVILIVAWCKWQFFIVWEINKTYLINTDTILRIYISRQQPWGSWMKSSGGRTPTPGHPRAGMTCWNWTLFTHWLWNCLRVEVPEPFWSWINCFCMKLVLILCKSFHLVLDWSWTE